MFVIPIYTDNLAALKMTQGNIIVLRLSIFCQEFFYLKNRDTGIMDNYSIEVGAVFTTMPYCYLLEVISKVFNSAG